jgi:hypothetical protein
MHTRVFRFFPLMVAIAGVVITAAACSSSSDTNLDDPAPEASSEQSARPSSASDAALVDAAADTRSTQDARAPDTGIPNVLDGGDLYEGGVPCVVGGVLEEESNDTPDTANTMAPTVCGATLPGTESDFVTFQLKPTTTSFLLYFDGNVSLTVSVEGGDGGVQTVTVTPTSFPPLPLLIGKKYSIEIRSLDKQRQNWRVSLFES